MPVVPPSPEELAELAARHGFRLGEADRKSFAGLVEANLAAHEAVEHLYARSAPSAPRRDYEWPADNPLGAWYVRTRIPPTGDDPLSGREVVIKDNIAVAGVPMMNGSRAVEGFVPRRNATVVSRVLAAGGTIVGKAVCEDLCYSGVQLHLRLWPGAQPVGPHPARRRLVVRQRCGFRPRSAAWSGTSRRTGSCPTPEHSPSKPRSTTSAR